MIIVTRKSVSIFIFIALLYLINLASADVHEGDNISVTLDHIFISKKNNSIEISEIVVFRNEGEDISYSKDNHTFFAISTPPDIKNLKTEAMECCLVQDEGIVYMDPMKSIKSGENFEMQISYTLITQDQEYIFNKNAIYNTSSVSMFIDKKSGMDIEGISEVMTLSGKEYKVITFNNLLVRENISIPVELTQESDYRYAGIGLFILLSAGLIYCFKDKISWRRKKESTIEELEIEKKNIFRTIHGFEKHAGPESSEEYRKLMEEYRQKAIRIFVKIDNLKNKSQFGFIQKGMKQPK
ncbi:MAG: hypothetical protein WC568_05070 [Candidatus Methanoperedens sp.]